MTWRLPKKKMSTLMVLWTNWCTNNPHARIQVTIGNTPRFIKLRFNVIYFSKNATYLYYITSDHVISCHVMSCQIKSYHISYHIIYHNTVQYNTAQHNSVRGPLQFASTRRINGVIQSEPLPVYAKTFMTKVTKNSTSPRWGINIIILYPLAWQAIRDLFANDQFIKLAEI